MEILYYTQMWLVTTMYFHYYMENKACEKKRNYGDPSKLQGL